MNKKLNHHSATHQVFHATYIVDRENRDPFGSGLTTERREEPKNVFVVRQNTVTSRTCFLRGPF